MGLYGMMRTSASGMAAQANRLGTVADNIANSSTTGYKRASARILLADPASRAVGVQIRQRRDPHPLRHQRAGRLQVHDLRRPTSPSRATASSSSQATRRPDLPHARRLVRAGRRRQSRQRRRLQADGLQPGGRQPQRGGQRHRRPRRSSIVGTLALQANPSTEGNLFVNLPSNATVVAAANLPVAPTPPPPTYTGKTSLVAYDNLGNEVTLDVYSTKTARQHLGGRRLRPRRRPAPAAAFPIRPAR